MTLLDEVQAARKKIVTDGYDMSMGELINLYRADELTIDPAFQRLFRWDDGRKTRFIESILLGIPFPSIFVYQDQNGVWELIDGLQRLSTRLIHRIWPKRLRAPEIAVDSSYYTRPSSSFGRTHG